MWIKVRNIDDVVHVSFTSSKILEEAMIEQIGDELMRLIDRPIEAKKLLLSFEGVHFMSSAMIGKLLAFNGRAKTCGIQVKLCDMAPNVLEVLKITHVVEEFDILGNRNAANFDNNDGWPGKA